MTPFIDESTSLTPTRFDKRMACRILEAHQGLRTTITVISTSPNLNIIEVLPDWASEIRCLRCPDIDVVKMWRVRPMGANGQT